MPDPSRGPDRLGKRRTAGISTTAGGSMNVSIAGTADSRAAFDRLLGDLRPKLHRYCARMTGSVIDGEDVVQEALAKAIEAFPDAGGIAHVEGWLFRIAHNSALDFLRRRIDQAQTYSLAER